MKKAVLVVNSVAGAALMTLLLTTVTILYLMFTSSQTPIYREGLFGGVFFRADNLADGGIGGSLGVANPLPLALIFSVLTLLLLVTQVIYRGLVGYRAGLVTTRAQAVR